MTGLRIGDHVKAAIDIMDWDNTCFAKHNDILEIRVIPNHPSKLHVAQIGSRRTFCVNVDEIRTLD